MTDLLPSEKAEAIKNNLVYMEDITVQFGKVLALDKADFRVRRNEIVGLLGDNGSGKSTLIKALIGYHSIVSGEMYFNGERAHFKSPWNARLAGIETASQSVAVVDILSVAGNFFLGRELQKRIGLLKLLDYKKMNRIASQTLKELGLALQESSDETIMSLSGGEKQAIVIGRAFYFGAKLLILDEPMTALSESEAEFVLRLVTKAKQKGMAVIFVTHRAHEVFEIADRFVVLQKGKGYVDLKKEDTTIKKLGKLLISSRLTAVREMAAGVAHQIRNPLGVMKLSVEMLRDDFNPRENQEDYDRITQTLVKEIDTLNLVVNNFLDFARPPTIHKTFCSIEEIIRDSLAHLLLTDFNTIEVIVQVQEAIPEYFMDGNLMNQVISNLVLNALQASPAHSSIEIRAFLENDLLAIEVQDWGCGLDGEKQKQIFHPFFTSKATGSGLGLSIAQRLVEQHHGTIDMVSSPGKGSTFRIVL
ncbi:MAG: ATP-binding cassette domain-containing protein [bacterium]|nr:ATP-binding cassette domain-containing protein [bacterium]